MILYLISSPWYLQTFWFCKEKFLFGHLESEGGIIYYWYFQVTIGTFIGLIAEHVVQPEIFYLWKGGDNQRWVRKVQTVNPGLGILSANFQLNKGKSSTPQLFMCAVNENELLIYHITLSWIFLSLIHVLTQRITHWQTKIYWFNDTDRQKDRQITDGQTDRQIDCLNDLSTGELRDSFERLISHLSINWRKTEWHLTEKTLDPIGKDLITN